MSERLDITLAMTWLALLAVGLVLVTSAAVAQPGGADYYLGKHAFFAVASMLAFLVVAVVPIRFWEAVHRPALLVAFALCALVLIPALSVEVNGARRWIDLGVFRFQPAEAAKFLAVLYLAGYVTRNGDALVERWTALLKPLVWMGALLVLLLLQPDFGTVVVLATLAGGLLFLGGARMRDFALLAVLGGILLGAAAVWDPYRVVRLVTFLDPWAEQFGSGYQLTQALIGFGRGEILGLGLGEGVQKLFYLPEAHNDFIYSVVAEELGLVGAAALLGLLAFLTVRLFHIGRCAAAEQRTFAALTAYGVALLIGVQTAINVGVNTGVLPTKGLTLPFISFGGNSLIVCSALVALALRVDYERRGPRAAVATPARGARTAAEISRRARGSRGDAARMEPALGGIAAEDVRA